MQQFRAIGAIICGLAAGFASYVDACRGSVYCHFGVEMRRRPEDCELLQVASQFYVDGFSQKQIAQRLRLHPSTVSRYLVEAKDRGLIQIHIKPSRLARLEASVLDILRPHGIMSVLVCENETFVANAAAEFISAAAGNALTLAIDRGPVMCKVAVLLSSAMPGTIDVVPIVTDPPSLPDSIFASLALINASDPRTVCHHPPFAIDRTLDYMHESIRTVGRQADVVLIGTEDWKTGGSLARLIQHLGIDPESLIHDHQGVRTWAAGLAIDSLGNVVDLPSLYRLLRRSLEPSELRSKASGQHCKVILLASGHSDATMVMSVVRSQMCNTLIVDGSLAAAIRDYSAATPGQVPT